MMNSTNQPQWMRDHMALLEQQRGQQQQNAQSGPSFNLGMLEQIMGGGGGAAAAPGAGVASTGGIAPIGTSYGAAAGSGAGAGGGMMSGLGALASNPIGWILGGALAQNVLDNKGIATWEDAAKGQSGAKTGEHFMDQWGVDDNSPIRDVAGVLGWGEGGGLLNPANQVGAIFDLFD